MIDIIKIYRDFNIQTADERDKHYRNGWVNCACPFCTGNPGFHLGFHINKQYFSCYRCGGKEIFYALKNLLKISTKQIKEIIGHDELRPKNKINKTEKAKEVVWPTGTIDGLNEQAKEYLIRRKFNPNKLQKEWNLKSTGNTGPYKFRILAPIYFHNKLVSFQGRDYSGLSAQKYKACAKDQEVIDHKEVLYGHDKASKYQKVVVVEGITDVWRLGAGAVATFGIEFTPAQISLLTRCRWEEFFIFYDPDHQGQKQAEKLAGYLEGIGKEVFILKSNVDPGDLSQNTADKLMKSLGFRN